MMNLAMDERRTEYPVFTTEELFRTFLVKELNEDGYDAEVIDVTRPTATSYRGVRIGISSVLSTTINIKSLYEEVRKGNISFAEAYDRFLDIYENSKKKCVMPDFVSRIRKEIGEEEFYILPSSKHEVIVMPAHLVTDPMHLVAMVKEVNASSVDEDDRLTDNVYFYNKDGEISAVIS